MSVATEVPQSTVPDIERTMVPINVTNRINYQTIEDALMDARGNENLRDDSEVDDICDTLDVSIPTSLYGNEVIGVKPAPNTHDDATLARGATDRSNKIIRSMRTGSKSSGDKDIPNVTSTEVVDLSMTVAQRRAQRKSAMARRTALWEQGTKQSSGTGVGQKSGVGSCCFVHGYVAK